MTKKKIVIIGAGIGGLGTAALLAKDGHQVIVLEKNDQLGGRARVLREKGFVFDMGPSWYLMPDAFDRFFAHFNKKPMDLLKLKKLDLQYRMFFGQDDYLDIVSDLEKNLNLFESIEKGAKLKINTYLEKSRQLYEKSMKHFVYKSYDSLFDLFTPKMLFDGPAINILENFDHYISRFTKNDRIKKILEYTIVFLGGSPQITPAVFSLLSHIDFHQGVFYPMGGINTLIQAIQDIGTEYGVTFHTNAAVTKILVENGKTTGVMCNGKIYNADIVVSNADYPFTETQLLEKKYQTYPISYWNKRTIAPSGFILYLGIKGKVKNLQHHNLILANDWQEHFNEMFSDPQWPTKPSYYVCCPSKTDATVAPEDCENLFILVPIAAGLNDTQERRAEYSQKIITHLQDTLKEKLDNRILYKKVFSINDFANDYNAFQGTALGLSQTFFQSAPFRPVNRSKKVSNLYYVGQFTQPGVGMPMCLISAQIVTKRMYEEQ